MMRVATLLFVLLAACVSLERGGIYAPDRDKVFVSYFGNETFYRDVEFLLTERVVREILSSPGLRLSSKEDAKVHLTGRVLNVVQSVLTESAVQVPLSSNTAITVEVTLTDARTGAVLRSAVVAANGQSVAARGETFATAQEEAFRFLARDIVRLFEKEF